MNITFIFIFTLIGILVCIAVVAEWIANAFEPLINDIFVPWVKRKMKHNILWNNHVWRKPAPPATTLDIPGGPYSPSDKSASLPQPPLDGSAERPDPRAVRLAEEFEAFRRDKAAARARAPFVPPLPLKYVREDAILPKQAINPENPDCPCSAYGCPCDIFGYSEVDDWPEDFDGCICTCDTRAMLADDNKMKAADMTVDEYIGAAKRNPIAEAITKRDNVKPTRRKCGNCGVVHEIPNSNCVDDREYREHIKARAPTPLRAYTPAEALERMGEELFCEDVICDGPRPCYPEQAEWDKQAPVLDQAFPTLAGPAGSGKAIKTAMDQMALGRAICAVANHSTPPTDVPCPACLNFAIVILTKLDDTGYGLASLKQEHPTP